MTLNEHCVTMDTADTTFSMKLKLPRNSLLIHSSWNIIALTVTVFFFSHSLQFISLQINSSSLRLRLSLIHYLPLRLFSLTTESCSCTVKGAKEQRSEWAHITYQAPSPLTDLSLNADLSVYVPLGVCQGERLCSTCCIHSKKAHVSFSQLNAKHIVYVRH